MSWNPTCPDLAGRGVATGYIAKEKRVRTLDFVGQISKNFPIDKLSDRSQLQRGAVAVGAPGNLAGWCELNKAHGKKKLPELFAPAIAIARDGFQLIEFNLEEIQGVAGELAGYKAPASRMVARLHRGRGHGEAGLRAEAARPRPHVGRAGHRRAPACSMVARSARRSSTG